jgi:hypothetical protein
MATAPSAHLRKKLLATEHRPKHAIAVAPLVIECSRLDTNGVYARLETRAEGLTAGEAQVRLLEHGPNVLAKDQRVRTRARVQGDIRAFMAGRVRKS